MKQVTLLSPLTLIKDAEAGTNPLVSTMRFVFVDNEPNANFQGVPESAFAGIIDTGQYMPLKVDEGFIGGHAVSKPIGTIKMLEQVGNRVEGIAAVWNEERPADVALLRERFAEEGLNISFELRYSEFEVDDDGVEWLLNPWVRAATIVADPAYQGRTPVLTLAEVNENVASLPDTSFAWVEPGGKVKDGITHPRSLRHFPYRDAEGNISKQLLNISLAQIEEADFDLKQDVQTVLKLAQAELDKEIKTVMDEDKLKEMEEIATNLRDRISELENEMNALTDERDSLLEYKEAREREDAEATLLKERLSTLTEAGFEFTAEEVESKRSFWLQLDENSFSTYVSEIKAIQESKASNAETVTVPDVTSDRAATSGFDVLNAHFKKEKNE